ncbi:hypothetical protein BDY21DRAFT_354974 [Lineolata rhizophorae]|uniref:BTB domain-containing protein n=1 Tax=Lineolata rhizophorae TaxID=578093 RepID=A0A6A6NPN7_9PEZI|nr:hypothetical protein BDY21DRAFT_354974 [Lineolata rhizophorae]
MRPSQPSEQPSGDELDRPSSSLLAWQKDRAASAPTLDAGSSGPSRVSTSNRTASPSLHSSGTPRANSLSGSRSSRPLAILAGTSSGSSRRMVRLGDEGLSNADQVEIPRAEKDVDDPTTPVDSRRSDERGEYATLTTLSRLFAGQSPPNPGASSRPSSYSLNTGGSGVRPLDSDGSNLPGHLYTRGLLGGRHSDILVAAFGHKYALHRLILDRAPFFATALSEPWLESTSKEITLHPEEIDQNITQTAFELALKRLYGCDIGDEEEGQAIGLFATACWLEMQDLIDSSIDAILRQMRPPKLSRLIRLVTANYYSRPGERILASAKAMLCRDGWEMPLRYWDGIPGDIVREMIGGDGFFIDGEWDRWVLAKRLLDRRLKHKAIEAGLVEHGSKGRIKAPDTLNLMAVRFDAVYRKNAIMSGRPAPESHARWQALYTHPDVEPLLVLLDEGIHYVHLEFEQLQYIRQARDVLGLPVMPEKVIANALWMAMELRQKVMNAGELDLELGLSQHVEKQSPRASQRGSPAHSRQSADSHNSEGKGKGKVLESAQEDPEEEMLSGSWDANGKPRKFWIPSTDCNIVMGGNSEPLVTTSSSSQRHASRLSASLQPEDAQWATDFSSISATDTNPRSSTANQAQVPPNGNNSNNEQGTPAPVSFTHFPPFRFAAEFPNPRMLKEKKRVYSRTVFYAGSLWNIYIQKVRSAKNPQLGVYLHRAKERDAEEVIAGTAGTSVTQTGSVNEHIGFLEREMLLRNERRDRRQLRGRPQDQSNSGVGIQAQGGDGGDTSGSGGDPDTMLVGTASSHHKAGFTARSVNTFTNQQRNAFGRSLSNVMSSSRRRRKNGSNAIETANTFQHVTGVVTPSSPSSDSDEDDYYPSLSPGLNIEPHGVSSFPSEPQQNDNRANVTSTRQVPRRVSLTGGARGSPRKLLPRVPVATRAPTLPPYVDSRPTIRTYFKIYSPSKGGRLLSLYESAPDRFNFSQSWGWRSSTLMLDEGLFGGDDALVGAGPAVSSTASGQEGNGPGMQSSVVGNGDGVSHVGNDEGKPIHVKKKVDGKLRFMVVIGNL